MLEFTATGDLYDCRSHSTEDLAHSFFNRGIRGARILCVILMITRMSVCSENILIFSANERRSEENVYKSCTYMNIC
jgi:hypothetical protein